MDLYYYNICCFKAGFSGINALSVHPECTLYIVQSLQCLIINDEVILYYILSILRSQRSLAGISSRARLTFTIHYNYIYMYAYIHNTQCIALHTHVHTYYTQLI